MEINSPRGSRNAREIETIDVDKEVIDLDPEVMMGDQELPNSDDIMSEVEFERWMACQQEMQKQPKHFRNSRNRANNIRNGPVMPPLVILDQCEHRGQLLRSRVNVELKDGDFMRITHIIKNVSTDEVLLRGRLFRRLTFMNGTLERKINEICWILHVDEDDARCLEEQSLEEISLSQVIKRRALKLTNQEFPALSWREENIGFKQLEEIVRNDRVLVCRWKYVCSYANALARKNNVHSNKIVSRLQQHESDKECGLDDDILTKQWRGKPMPGGASFLMTRKEIEHRQTEQILAQQALKQLRPADCMSLRPRKRSISESISHPSQRDTVDLTVDNDLQAGLQLISLGTEQYGNPSSGKEFPGSCEEIIQVRANTVTTSSRSVPERNFNGVVMSERLQSYDLSRGGIDQERRRPSDLTPKRQRVISSISSALSRSDMPLNEEYSISSRLWCPPLPTTVGPLTGSGRSTSVIDLCGNDERAPTDLVNKKIPRTPDPAIFSSCNLGAYKSRNGKGCRDLSIQRYTYADAFCGCGGTSRGATMAGLHLKWAFDCEKDMCASYHKNFPTAKTYCLTADQFTMRNMADTAVDILHMSPPCQFFSPAHTVSGQHDERNTASSFVITELLKKVRPRIVTLENTLGLERRHPLYLHAVLQQFTVLGFSVAWKILKLTDYGVPQSRDRLIIIAACPGEPLPNFPEPTHSKYPSETGLKPWTTINENIGLIPRLWPNHRPQLSRDIIKAPFSGDTQAKCITTSGGENNHHPSGRRCYTVRELACLQTFPLEHMFADACDTILKTQVGNSVPPLFAKALMEECKRSMMEADSLRKDDHTRPVRSMSVESSQTLRNSSPDSASPTSIDGSFQDDPVIID